MPTYQYACTQCDERLEAVQSFSDAALTDCPACSGRLRKVFSAVGVVFKGSGFYKTDSRGTPEGAKSDGAGAESSGAKDGSGSGSGKDGGVKADGGGSSSGASTAGKDGGGTKAGAGAGAGSGSSSGAASKAS